MRGVFNNFSVFKGEPTADGGRKCLPFLWPSVAAAAATAYTQKYGTAVTAADLEKDVEAKIFERPWQAVWAM